MGSKVWTAGNLYVNQSGKIVQLMAVARQEGSAQELAIYQEMHAPFTVWAKSLSAFEATYHKMAEVLEEKRVPQERTVEASGEKRAPQERTAEASGAKSALQESVSEVSAQDLSQENESEAFENQRTQGENVPAGGENVPAGGADVSEEELRMALEKGQPEKYLSGRITETEIARRGMLQILDAESFREKRQLLVGLRPYIDKLLLHNIAAALDVVLEEGTLDDQFESLLHCVDAHARYEGGRLRS